ncbi:MAG: TIGR04222 domain-containing membrane protein, partial [Magnetococcales bacterium]|nr:TIGR04222 domain-containing membrane protein [Magnetococcales bacterium]
QVDQLVNNLEAMGLVQPKSRKNYRFRVFVFSLLLWLIGGIKLLMGLTHHRPGFFLFLLLVVSQILLVLILRQGRFLTTQGRRFMAATRKEFSWMKSLDKNSITDPGVDSALGVALFGTVFLLALPGAAGAFDLFKPGMMDTTPSYDGFGTGAFGGGDGGSSDGDGGGGGGGCGGCGGGGD